MKSIKVSIASERQMRKRRGDLLKDALKGELVELECQSYDAKGKNGTIMKPSPFVYAPDLVTLVTEFLERHYE